MRFTKKPVEVSAYRTDVDMDVDNGQGVLHAKAGDYIVTGTNGEAYPCDADIFAATYNATDVAGVFCKKPVTVEAEQMHDSGVVDTLEGPEPYQPTDWIVTGVAGERYPVPNDRFREIYDMQGLHFDADGYLDPESYAFRERLSGMTDAWNQGPEGSVTPDVQSAVVRGMDSDYESDDGVVSFLSDRNRSDLKLGERIEDWSMNHAQVADQAMAIQRGNKSDGIDL